MLSALFLALLSGAIALKTSPDIQRQPHQERKEVQTNGARKTQVTPKGVPATLQRTSAKRKTVKPRRKDVIRGAEKGLKASLLEFTSNQLKLPKLDLNTKAASSGQASGKSASDVPPASLLQATQEKKKDKELMKKVDEASSQIPRGLSSLKQEAPESLKQEAPGDETSVFHFVALCGTAIVILLLVLVLGNFCIRMRKAGATAAAAKLTSDSDEASSVETDSTDQALKQRMNRFKQRLGLEEKQRSFVASSSSDSGSDVVPDAKLSEEAKKRSERLLGKLTG